MEMIKPYSNCNIFQTIRRKRRHFKRPCFERVDGVLVDYNQHHNFKILLILKTGLWTSNEIRSDQTQLGEVAVASSNTKKKTKSMCGNGTLYQGFLQVEKVWLLESRNRTHTFAGIVQSNWSSKIRYLGR